MGKTDTSDTHAQQCNLYSTVSATKHAHENFMSH